MSDHSAIDTMLATAMRGDVSEWSILSSFKPAGDGTPIEAVRERIAFHGITVALHHNLQQLTNWPEELLAWLSDEARIAGLWEETHRDCIASLIEALSQYNVRTVVMKGTALAYSLYHDATLRRRGDTDLLVQPSDLTRTRETLQSSGWSRRESPNGLIYQETWLFDTGAGFVHELDLHWQPNDSPALQTVLRNGDFFVQARSLPRLSQSAKMPSPVLTLIQIAINQAWHQTRGLSVEGAKVPGGERLIWARDFDLLARGFSKEEWSALVEISTTRNIGPVLMDALSAAHAAFATPIPGEVMERLSEPPRDTAILEYLAEPDLIREFKVNLRSIPSLRGKVHLILANAWSTRAHLVQKYPDHSHWPTIALQAQRIGQSVVRLAMAGRRR